MASLPLQQQKSYGCCSKMLRGQLTSRVQKKKAHCHHHVRSQVCKKSGFETKKSGFETKRPCNRVHACRICLDTSHPTYEHPAEGGGGANAS